MPLYILYTYSIIDIAYKVGMGGRGLKENVKKLRNSSTLNKENMQ